LGKRSTTLETATGEHESFDHIILACHSNDVLQILDAGSGATPVEREALGAGHWCSNEVWLHSDERVGICFPFLFLF
jgi:predicted NAD/FAD-binding protein